MSRMFRYIQNEDVVKSFLELRDTVLKDRPVVIARHGDYSLFLKAVSDIALGITIEDTVRHRVFQDRSFNIETTPGEIVARGVRHACQKMAELSDADVNRKRLQIWKWYILDWQQANTSTAKDFVAHRNLFKWSSWRSPQAQPCIKQESQAMQIQEAHDAQIAC